ncbi:hypothetical protein ACGH7X_41830 [Streptomyces sp. BBFR51]|uniref:hypothetical protein n=1 Tax=Streptomyces sp. BBFR51 TaxID=3372856 RepID=UPI0037DCDB17
MLDRRGNLHRVHTRAVRFGFTVHVVAGRFDELLRPDGRQQQAGAVRADSRDEPEEPLPGVPAEEVEAVAGPRSCCLKGITKLDRPFADYSKHDVHITPSGMWNQAQLRNCVETLGIERIVLAVGYPFVGNEGVAAFLDEADMCVEDENRMAHGTAERLLGL